MSVAASGDDVAAAGGRGRHVYVLALAVALLVASLVALAAGPVGYRTGLLGLDAARVDTLNWVGVFAVAGGVLAFAGLVMGLMARSSKGVIVAALVILAALLIGFRVVGMKVQRAGLPPIHDAQTDWDQPVAFTGRALEIREREGAAAVRDDARIAESYGAPWAGESFAQAQAQFWELEPMHLEMSPPDATVLADQVARDNGWIVVLSDPPGGQIEAVHHSLWYGLASDIAVRVLPDGEGARVDVRSASRNGGPDMGANAQRIKVYLDDLAQAAR